MSGAAEKGSTGTTKTPADFLKSIRGRPVVVKLNSGVDYRGQSLTPISITTHLFMVISLCLIFLVLVIKIAFFFSFRLCRSHDAFLRILLEPSFRLEQLNKYV